MKRRKNITKLKKELWDLCKALTRKNHGYFCFTCGNPVQYPHTGHFIPSSICSTELRYDLKNLRPQCFSCNIHKSGNWVAFEAKFDQLYGKSYVRELKKRNEKTKGRKYDILWVEAKIEEYKQLLK